MDSSQKKLTANEAQRLMLELLKAARRQIDMAARAPLARDRARALRRLARALAAVTKKE